MYTHILFSSICFLFSLCLCSTDSYITIIYILSYSYTGEIGLKSYSIEFVTLSRQTKWQKKNEKSVDGSTCKLNYVSVRIQRSIYTFVNKWKEFSYLLLITAFQSNIGMLFFSSRSLYVVSAKVKWVNEWMSDNRQGLFFLQHRDVVKKKVDKGEEETSETNRIRESQSKRTHSFVQLNRRRRWSSRMIDDTTVTATDVVVWLEEEDRFFFLPLSLSHTFFFFFIDSYACVNICATIKK
jgi:hypothetical protein